MKFLSLLIFFSSSIIAPKKDQVKQRSINRQLLVMKAELILVLNNILMFL